MTLLSQSVRQTFRPDDDVQPDRGHQSEADRPPATCNGVTAGSPEAGSVRLHGSNVGLGSELAKSFFTECARCIEGLRTDREIKEAWHLDDREWDRLGENIPLLSAVRAELDRRIRSGEAAREAAQRHFANAPSVLNEILHNQLMSPRHRIEAARELRHVAANGPETSAAAEKFVINIDLGGDNKLLIETEIVPKPPTAEEKEW
jgi:hypothetical protein